MIPDETLTTIRGWLNQLAPRSDDDSAFAGPLAGVLVVSPHLQPMPPSTDWHILVERRANAWLLRDRQDRLIELPPADTDTVARLAIRAAAFSQAGRPTPLDVQTLLLDCTQVQDIKLHWTDSIAGIRRLTQTASIGDIRIGICTLVDECSHVLQIFKIEPVLAQIKVPGKSLCVNAIRNMTDLNGQIGRVIWLADA